MAGPIETAYIELQPKVSRTFGADALREINPELNKVGAAVERSLGRNFEAGSAKAGASLKKIDSASTSAARQIDASTKKAGASIDKNISRGADQASKSLNGVKTIAAAVFAGISVRAIKEGVGAVVGEASDLSETLSKVNVILGSGAKGAIAFSKGTETAFGQSQQQALDAIATFAAFGKSAGLSGQGLTDFSTKFDGLASDLASFNNTSPEQAIDAIGAALRGETEPIRAYNVLLDDASLRQKALELGIVKTTKDALTPQQRVLATSALIFEKTKDAQGDFARTSGGLANQQRIAAAQTSRLKVALGNALLPVMVTVTKVINKDFLPPLISLAEKHGPKVAAVLGGIGTSSGPKLTEFLTKASSLFHSLSDGTNEASPALTSLQDSGSKLVPVVKQLVDQIPSFTDVLNVGAVVIGFFADHTDTLIKLMPLLIAGIVAYKAAQLLANIAATLSLPTKIAEVIVNRQLVKSNRELIAARAANTAAQITESASTAVDTVAKGANTAATNATVAASSRGRIATLALAAAQRVSAAATAVWTVAQRALTFAFIASPIGLIVLAIAGLVTVIVLVATKTNFFQTVWKKAWGAIQTAFSAAFNFVKNNWPLILAILTGPIGLAVLLIVKNFDKIKSVVSTVVGAMKEAFRVGIKFIVDSFLGLIGTILSAQAKAFGWVPGLGGKLKGASEAFNKFRDNVNKSLDGITDEAVNVSLTTTKRNLGSNVPVERKDGGFLPGYTPGRDVHRFVSPTGGVLDLSGGEPILRPEAGRVLGRGWVDGINKAARRAGTGGVEDFLGRFANGGILLKTMLPGTKRLTSLSSSIAQDFGNQIASDRARLGVNPSLGKVLTFVRQHVGDPYGWGSVGPNSFDCSGLVSAAINTAFNRFPYSRLGSTGSMIWKGLAPGKGAFSVGYFKGNPGHMAATVNGVNIESSGGVGVHMGKSARGATNPLFTNIAHVKGFRKGGILDQLGDAPFDLLSPRGKHYLGKDVQEALTRGLFVRDHGGDLPLGASLTVNKTGKRERVISPAEEAHRGSGDYIAKQVNNDIEITLQGTGNSESDATRVASRIASWSER